MTSLFAGNQSIFGQPGLIDRPFDIFSATGHVNEFLSRLTNQSRAPVFYPDKNTTKIKSCQHRSTGLR